nr:MAG TPA: hypothetical protein [Caudoviricetes sp.]
MDKGLISLIQLGYPLYTITMIHDIKKEKIYR